MYTREGQTVYVQYFSSHNIKKRKKKKKKPEGLSTTVLAYPMCFDVFLSCLVLHSEHLSVIWCLRRDVRGSPDINPNVQTFTSHH